jgi:transposase-like protein
MSPVYTEKSKKRGRHKIGESVDNDSSKKYRCVACGKTFDVPIVE